MSESLRPNSFDEIREEHARFKKAGERLAAALSRISYVCGPPNEMGVSNYDVWPDEDAVVSRVVQLAMQIATTRELLRRSEVYLMELAQSPEIGNGERLDLAEILEGIAALDLEGR